MIKVLVVSLSTLLLASTSMHSIAQVKKESVEDVSVKQKGQKDQVVKQTEKEAQKAKEEAERSREEAKAAKEAAIKESKESKEEAMKSSKEAKELSKEAKDEAFEKMKEAKNEANEAKSKAREYSESARAQGEATREDLKPVYTQKFKIPQKEYDRYKDMGEEEMLKLSPEERLSAKRVKALEKIAEADMRYAENKAQLKAARAKLEADKATGKFSGEELKARELKLNEIADRLSSTRKKVESEKEELKK